MAKLNTENWLLPNSSPRFIDVCAAVIERDHRILVARRSEKMHLAGKWEFPGGKVEAGETLAACIVREMLEELGMTVGNPQCLTVVEHADSDHCVRLHFLRCDAQDPADHDPREHDEVRWVTHAELAQLDLAPADRRFVNWFLADRRFANA